MPSALGVRCLAAGPSRRPMLQPPLNPPHVYCGLHPNHVEPLLAIRVCMPCVVCLCEQVLGAARARAEREEWEHRERQARDRYHRDFQDGGREGRGWVRGGYGERD